MMIVQRVQFKPNIIVQQSLNGPIRLVQQITYLAKRDIKCICTGFSSVHKIGSIFSFLPSKISLLKGTVKAGHVRFTIGN